MAEYNDWGEEIPDDTPVEVPLRFQRARAPSIHELIAMYIRNEQALSRTMGDRPESEEEEDFEVDEDGGEEILTPYELHALAAETDAEYSRRARQLSRDRELDHGSKRVEDSAGVGSDRKGAGEGEAAKAGPAKSEDGGGAGAKKAGTTPEG